MRVSDVRVAASPLGERVRLSATVAYDTGGVSPETYWFDVPAAHGPELADSGNPWLACLLPLAATLGEPLHIPLAVDRPLLANAERLLRIWRAWYPDLSVVDVEADATDGEATPARTGAFFSGGADSFFTMLRCRATAPPAERTPIQDAIVVHGFDVPLERPEAFDRLRRRLEPVAAVLGAQLIDVATNLRATRWSVANWSYLAHGAGLAGVALALEKRFHTVYIAGGGGYRGLHPWGSHSVTDPLFSTTRTSIVYDAVSYLRTEKLERIAGSELALGALHVCYELSSDENCGGCNKCRRTMLALEVCGALERCATFPRLTIDLEEVAAMDCSYFADRRELEDIRALAVARGRQDVVAALDRSVAATERRQSAQRRRARLRRPLDLLAALAGRGRR